MEQNQLRNAIRDYLPLRGKDSEEARDAHRALEKAANGRQLSKDQLTMAMARQISGGYRK